MSFRIAIPAALGLALIVAGGCERQSPYDADPSVSGAVGTVPMTVYVRPEPNVLADQEAVSAQFMQAASEEATAAAKPKPPSAAPAERPSVSAVAEPALPENPLARKAYQVVELLRAGKAEDVYKMLDAMKQKDLKPDNISQAWTSFTMPLGAFQEILAPEVGQGNIGNTPVLVPCRFEKGRLDVTVAFNQGGQISQLSMQPAEAPQPAPAPAGPAAPGAPEAVARLNMARIQQAHKVVNMLLSREFQAVHAMFDRNMQQALPSTKLAEGWTLHAGSLGAWQSMTSQLGPAVGQDTPVQVQCQFERGGLDVMVVFDQQGNISGLWLKPAGGTEAAPEGGMPATMPPGGTAPTATSQPARLAPPGPPDADESAASAGKRSTQETLKAIWQRLGAKEAPAAR
jgi:hypothetical protein